MFSPARWEEESDNTHEEGWFVDVRKKCVEFQAQSQALKDWEFLALCQFHFTDPILGNSYRHRRRCLHLGLPGGWLER